MKNYQLIILLVVLSGYFSMVVVPNYVELKNYNDCVSNSITEADTVKYSYIGNVRNDTVTPKTCVDSGGSATLEQRNVFVPAFFQ